ncbi:MAG: Bifunctional protein FolD protein [Firmicutes bacterium ADurb.Bin182]|nr:MAG: Bifunctional protein FolD protein [Firmicutes bacterium ADurb.Bin182]
MAKLLMGKEVTAALNERIKSRVNELKAKNVFPKLAVLRVGAREDDLSYERSLIKRCDAVGIEVKPVFLPEDVTQAELVGSVRELNEDITVHGVLIFRPLPKHLDDEEVRKTLHTRKDIDGITDGSLAGVYSGANLGYPPCTAEACIEILNHYGVEIEGKKCVVVGRSLVIGKPVSMMLLGKNATVTMCHSRTRDLAGICRDADILIAAIGKAGFIKAEHLSRGQTVIDVGINVDENGKLTGDVKFDDAENLVEAVTPVPGGVGTVTTSVLASHVAEAAFRASMPK